MSTCGAGERADEYEAIGDGRDAGQEFGDADARQAGFDSFEFAADFDGCFGFGVDGIEVWWSAIEVNIDDGFLGVAEVGGGFCAEQIGECESGDSEGANLQGTAAGVSRCRGSGEGSLERHGGVSEGRWAVAGGVFCRENRVAHSEIRRNSGGFGAQVAAGNS